MEENKHIQTLFKKYLENEASAIEIDQLYAYFQHAHHESNLRAQILHTLEKEGLPDHHLAERARDLAKRVEIRLFEGSLANSVPSNEKSNLENTEGSTIRLKPKRSSNYWIRYGAVAALVLAVSWLAIFMYEGKAIFKTASNQSSELESLNILPGNGQTTLTLADGNAVNLDVGQSGISLDANGQLMYLDGVTPVHTQGSDLANSSKSNLQTLSTAPGGMYSLVLSDSTRVWLNSASSLRFPAHFTAGNDRVVELNGEAYFDVASHRKGTKFIVKTMNHTVEVTGTAFNVNAYADEPVAHTTLLEGVVHIREQNQTGTANAEEEVFTLRPGEQATVAQNKTSISKVDPQSFIAWRDGKFSFEGKSLATVSREIARWYDLDIRFEGIDPVKLQSKLFGEADRHQDITFFIKLLDAGGFDYQLDDRVLTIKRKEENGKP